MTAAIVLVAFRMPDSVLADARTLAANDLNVLERAAKKTAASGTIDDMSRAHFREVERQIAAARSASRNYTAKEPFFREGRRL